MRTIIEWSVHKPVLANILMVFLLVVGAITAYHTRRETLPEFSLDLVQVSVEYKGASAEEIEEAICVRIEEQITGIKGIKKITSRAVEGLGLVTAELKEEADARKALDDIRNEVEQIDTFPEDAEKPVTFEVTLKRPVIKVSVYGDISEEVLTETAKEVRDDLLALPGISQVELFGDREYEVLVEISEGTLKKYGLTLSTVADLINRNSLDMPGGNLDTGAGEILLRTKGQRYRASEFADLVVLSEREGAVIRLADIATLTDTFEDKDVHPRMDGKPAIVINVDKTSEEDALEIAQEVKDYVKERNRSLPPSVRLKVWSDDSLVIRSRLDLLTTNALQGLALVFLILALFLKLRLAFWVTMGIPISVIGAFVFLGQLDFTLNMITMFSFIVVLGVVVDDAIVIGENVFTKITQGHSPVDAAIMGASEIAYPVISSVVTTIVAFSPMFFVAGRMGKLIQFFPVAIVVVLTVSLFEAFIILPSHLAHMKTRERATSPWNIFVISERIRLKMDAWLQNVIVRRFASVMDMAIRHRYVVTTSILALLILSLGLVASGRIGFVLFPKMDSDFLSASVTFPAGTSIDTTQNAVTRLENAVATLDKKYGRKDGRSIVLRTFSIAGDTLGDTDSGSHVAEIIVELMPSEERGVASSELVAIWRELTGEIPDTLALTFSNDLPNSPKPGGTPIEIQLLGTDMHKLRNAATALKQKLAGFDGVEDIQDSYRPAKQEYRLSLKPGARQLGITLADLAQQTRANFWGDEAIKVQRGRDEVTVRVRYPYQGRSAAGDLESMKVRSPDNRQIPFNQVATVIEYQGPAVIERVHRKRAITVTADVDEDKANAAQILKSLSDGFFHEFRQEYPGIKILLEGQQKETEESMGTLMNGFLIALAIIYVLLVLQFGTYTHPIVVMIAIPFSLIGVIAGHLLFRIDLTLFSMLGVVALAGIVINDSLLLVHSTNTECDQGKPLTEALLTAGKGRFRQVMLTSISTMAGLTPILAETSFQAQFLKPMTVSVVFGLLFSTILVLLFIPALVMIREDLIGIVKR